MIGSISFGNCKVEASGFGCFDFLNLYSESIDFKVSYALGLALASFNNLNAL